MIDSLRWEADQILVQADSLHSAIANRMYSDATDMARVDSLRAVAEQIYARIDSLEAAAQETSGFPWFWLMLGLVLMGAAFAFIKGWTKIVISGITYAGIILVIWLFGRHADASYIQQMLILQILTAVAGLSLIYLATKPKNWLFDLKQDTGDPGPARMHWPSLIGCWIFFVGALLVWQNGFIGLGLMAIGWALGGVLSVPLLQIMIPTFFGRPFYGRPGGASKDTIKAQVDQEFGHKGKKKTKFTRAVFWERLVLTGNRGRGDNEGMLWFKNGLGLLLLPLWLPFVSIITLVQNRVELTDFTEEVPTKGSDILNSINKEATTEEGKPMPSLTVAPIRFKLWMVVFANDDPEVILKLSPPDRSQVKKMAISGAQGWFADTAIGMTFEAAMVAPFFQGDREGTDLKDLVKLVRKNVGHLVTQVKVIDRNPPEAVQKSLAAITETAAKKVQAKLNVEIERLAGDAIQARVKQVADSLGLTPAETWAKIIDEKRSERATSQWVVSDQVAGPVKRIIGG